MSKRTSLGRPISLIVATPKGASLGRGGRGGSSSASGNDDQFADDRGNIREYFDEGIRPSSRPAGRGDSSSAENYGKYLEESMLDMEVWQSKLKTGRKNRLTLVYRQVSKHTTGSIWIHQHRLRLEKERGGPVSSLEFYQRCHRKRGFVSEYITMRAKNVAEKHLDMMEEMYEEDNSCHPRVGDREI
ncbi:transposase, Ptta/En/Spm [Tanacetum coccineum]